MPWLSLSLKVFSVFSCSSSPILQRFQASNFIQMLSPMDMHLENICTGKYVALLLQLATMRCILCECTKRRVSCLHIKLFKSFSIMKWPVCHLTGVRVTRFADKMTREKQKRPVQGVGGSHQRPDCSLGYTSALIEVRERWWFLLLNQAKIFLSFLLNKVLWESKWYHKKSSLSPRNFL